MVGRSFHSPGSGWESRQQVREWSGFPPVGPEVVGRPSRRSGSGWETLPEVRKWSESLLDKRKWLGDPPGGPKAIRDHQ